MLKIEDGFKYLESSLGGQKQATVESGLSFIAHKELASIRKLVLVRCTVGNKYTKTFTTVLVCPEVCSKRGICSQFKLRLLSRPG